MKHMICYYFNANTTCPSGHQAGELSGSYAQSKAKSALFLMPARYGGARIDHAT